MAPHRSGRTAQQRYADLLLGRSVDEFIAEHKVNGLSFRKIAVALRDATDGEIDVSDVTVGQWHSDAASRLAGDAA